LAKDIRKALEEGGAEVIVLRCIGFMEYAMELQKRLDVPVVHSSIAAVKVAELLVSMDLSHNRLTTPSPGLLGVGFFIK
jgi:allantoin racemase